MRQDIFNRTIVGMALVVFCVVSFSGCASLRKKFTRVKKDKDKREEFIPVLQPIEYKKVEEKPVQVYAQHYAMVKVYFKDLWDILGKADSNAKREKYILNEILSHFDGMAALLVDPKRGEAGKMRERLNASLAVYDQPEGLRRYDLMAIGLRVIERDLYKLFKPGVVEGDLVAAIP